MTAPKVSPETPVLTVHEAVNKVMESVREVRKGEVVNAGQTRFSFRGVDAVMNAVGPALREYGVIITPTSVVTHFERYDTQRGGTMVGCTVVVGYRVFGPDGSYFDGACAGGASDSGDKSVPKAMSVAYRTFLLQMLCMPTDDPDPDTEVHERVSAQKLQTVAAVPRKEEAHTILVTRIAPITDPAMKISQIAKFKEVYADVLGESIMHNGATITLDRLVDDLATEVLAPVQEPLA